MCVCVSVCECVCAHVCACVCVCVGGDIRVYEMSSRHKNSSMELAVI